MPATKSDTKAWTSDSDAMPPVSITIGRIEVRLVPPPPSQDRVAVKRQPARSLEQYLTARREQ
jgi:hypothetical protein